MRVLLISSAARGHAIADALARSASQPEIISVCSAANPGIDALATEQHVLPVTQLDAIVDIAKATKPDFAFIGPEDPIALGMTDALAAEGIQCVAPTKDHARIESSKGFARELMEHHGIDASPKYRVFTTPDFQTIQQYIEQELNGQYVIKYDALKGGKGVKVSGEHLASIEEGVAYAVECVNECGQVVVEEKLVGVEFSLISFVSGSQVVDTPAIQDHKRAYEGDTGPNTGGMGTYSDANHSLPFLSESDLARAKEINRAVAQALMETNGSPFTGLLYGGFIAVKDGVRVIEYNARFGDPEALNILPLLTSDFVTVCQSIIDGSLREDLISFAPKATVCKYITPKGYSENKEQHGSIVSFPPPPENVRVFYGDIHRQDNGSLTLGGSRTAGVVGIADTIEEAEKAAQSYCESVDGPVRFRSDIGRAALIAQRSTTLQQLRQIS
jgi:phosphoribosylamine--glycine ligase